MINDELLHKWINGTLAGKELSEFKQRPEYEELLLLYNKTDFLEPEEGTNTIVINSENQQVNQLFSDGSACTLYEYGEVKYNNKSWSEKRFVELKGKATFKVVPGIPFTVKTNKSTILVLGTIFTVDENEVQLKVNCEEGKVKVNSLNGKVAEILKAEENIKINYNEESWVTYKANLTKLKNVSLKTVFDALEKQYSVKFKQKKSLDLGQKINCNFQHNNLDNALKSTLTPFALKYSVKNNTVIIE